MTHLARLGLLLFAGLAALALVRYASSRTTVAVIGLVRGDNASRWALLQPQLPRAAQQLTPDSRRQAGAGVN